MHHNCGFFLEQPDVSVQQQDVIGPTKCAVFYLQTLEAVSHSRDKMETVWFLLLQGFY